ncbi:hypothetical protein IAT40_002542 [Kwoniella sp. CBS 6097]
MPHTTTSPLASSLSPKASHSIPHNPNINPFAPLSPDLPENQLLRSHAVMEGDDQISRLLGLRTHSPTATLIEHKELVVYPREELLLISKKCGRAKPESMASLDTWYGTTNKPNNQQHVDDPAIASIGPPGSRRGGFGEGFGFGGGIGGRNIGRGGGRNIGLRRQPDTGQLDANGLPIDTRSFAAGQMGHFSVPLRNTTMRLGGNEPKRERRKEDEWRSREPHPPRDRNNNYRDGHSNNNNYNNRDRDRRPQYPPDDDGIEPAWMDDEAPADPAIVESSDPLIKFIPGEDMIAANRPGIKSRDTGGGWRADGGAGGGGLPAFFSTADPAIASSSAPTGLSGPPPGLGGIKPKSFNAADYLMQSKAVVDDEGEEEQSPAQPQPSSAFTSRFQKFFASPSPGQPSGPALGPSPGPALGGHSPGPAPGPGPIPVHSPIEKPNVEAKSPAESKDDRMAKLMGLLTTKATPPEPSPSYDSPRNDFRHISSPPESTHGHPHLHSNPHVNAQSPGPAPSVSPNYFPANGGAGGRSSSHPNALLQQLYGSDRPMPPDPLQLLAQAQAQGQAQRQQQQPRPYQQAPQAQMSLPPQFARPPPNLYPEESFSPYGHGQAPSPFPNPNGPVPGPGHGHGPQPPPPPGYLPPPHFYQGPPRPPQMPMGYPGPGPAPGFPPQQGLQPGPRQYPLGPGPGPGSGAGPAGHGGAQHQQDMLATLFAGLGPRN